MHYIAPVIESRTPVTALMTIPISGGPISPRWKKKPADEATDDARSDD